MPCTNFQLSERSKNCGRPESELVPLTDKMSDIKYRSVCGMSSSFSHSRIRTE